MFFRCYLSKANFFIKIVLLGFLLCFKAVALDTKIPGNDDEWNIAINSLNWQEGPKLVNFNEANSKINISSDFAILEKEDAQQWLYWINGVPFDHINVYATDSNNVQYMFFYSDTGYVKTDDWTDVDPDKFIKEIKENYKYDNETRKKNSQPTILNVTWKKKPYLDGVYNSVYYALNVQWSDNTSSTEGTAIILGREGYTSAKYVAGDLGYQENMLLNLSKIHKFNATKEYKDWKSGDKIAAAGIGALLASTLGIKAMKPGIIAAALLLLKKFWFIIFLPFIWLGKFFTGSSKKNKR